MDMCLTDKIAVVTGASRGIGLAVSQAFVAAGAYVIGRARHNSPELQALEAAGSATFIVADLATARGPQTLVAAAAERAGVDILVNNAGALTPHLGGFLTVTDQDWEAALSVGLMDLLQCHRIPQIVDQNRNCCPRLAHSQSHRVDAMIQ